MGRRQPLIAGSPIPSGTGSPKEGRKEGTLYPCTDPDARAHAHEQRVCLILGTLGIEVGYADRRATIARMLWRAGEDAELIRELWRWAIEQRARSPRGLVAHWLHSGKWRMIVLDMRRIERPAAKADPRIEEQEAQIAAEDEQEGLSVEQASARRRWPAVKVEFLRARWRESYSPEAVRAKANRGAFGRVK